MSNPAIVLMTDPSRCSLGDVHYLVQALLEMQQMGQHAAPQAFCDHPAAAKDFIAAYAHAYPQLVLQDREIPTPDHLQSLITTGQIGGLARPFDVASPGNAGFGGPGFAGMPRPAEQTGTSGFPIVVLTLGSSQALVDALHQSSAMKESIRLIDIVPDGADGPPPSIAEAVAIHGLDGDSLFEDQGARAELDEVAGPSTTDSAGLALRDERMSLDVVETEDASGSALPVDDQDGEQEPGAAESSSAAAQPEPVVVTEQPAEPTLSDDSYGAAAEPALETAAAPAATWPSGVAPVEQAAEPDDLTAQDPEAAAESGEEGQQDDERQAAQGVLEPDDDIYYQPVGSLLAGADVLYPARDQAYGALHELAAVLLDDGMIDPDLANEILAARDDGGALAGRTDAIVSRTSDLVTIEDLYGDFDQDSEDDLADATISRPLHDSDL